MQLTKSQIVIGGGRADCSRGGDSSPWISGAMPHFVTGRRHSKITRYLIIKRHVNATVLRFAVAHIWGLLPSKMPSLSTISYLASWNICLLKRRFHFRPFGDFGLFVHFPRIFRPIFAAVFVLLFRWCLLKEWSISGRHAPRPSQQRCSQMLVPWKVLQAPKWWEPFKTSESKLPYF